ncbi:MAG: hypothetical protein ABJA35_16205 [Parafilimonas sp.]
MRIVIFILGIFFSFLLSCKKNTNSPVSPRLKLIQHGWNVLSVRTFLPNGSNYILLNDYQFFRSDNLQITQTKDIFSTIYDTSKYMLLTDDSTLLFYPIQNGVQSLTADTGIIQTINESLFVYYFRQNGFINFIDSLKR